MARYRKIEVKIWGDDKFPFFSDDAQLVWFHLYTNDRTTGMGIYRASMEALAADKRWPFERYSKAFKELFRKGLIKYDETYHVVYFPKFLGDVRNKPDNPNVLKGWISLLEEIPDNPLKLDFINKLIELVPIWDSQSGSDKNPYGAVCETLPEGFGEHFRKQDQDQDQEQEQENTSAVTDKTGQPPIEKISFDYRTGKFSNITAEDTERWSKAFPAVDVIPDLRRAAAWAKANPKNRKSNWEKFIFNWLTRTQDKAGRVANKSIRNRGKEQEALLEKL